MEGARAGDADGDHANTYMFHADCSCVPVNRKKNWAGIFSFQTGLTFVPYFVTFKLDIRIKDPIVSLLLEIQIQFCFLYIGRYVCRD